MDMEATEKPAIEWPERPTCHDKDWHAQRFDLTTWRPPREAKQDDPYVQPFRTCSYCGSMHPEDLLAALRAGAVLSLADMKYGWPHKFYVDNMPNPKAGEPVVSYSYCGRPDEKMLAEGGWEQYDDGFDSVTGAPKKSWRKPHPPHPAPANTHGKFYNVHLMDLPEPAFNELAVLIEAKSPVRFWREAGKTMYGPARRAAA